VRGKLVLVVGLRQPGPGDRRETRSRTSPRRPAENGRQAGPASRTYRSRSRAISAP
jgi:hypothetical protein